MSLLETHGIFWFLIAVKSASSLASELYGTGIWVFRLARSTRKFSGVSGKWRQFFCYRNVKKSLKTRDMEFEGSFDLNLNFPSIKRSVEEAEANPHTEAVFFIHILVPHEPTDSHWIWNVLHRWLHSRKCEAQNCLSRLDSLQGLSKRCGNSKKQLSLRGYSENLMEEEHLIEIKIRFWLDWIFAFNLPALWFSSQSSTLVRTALVIRTKYSHVRTRTWGPKREAKKICSVVFWWTKTCQEN